MVHDDEWIYVMLSETHVAGLFKHENNYYFYDPNDSMGEYKTSSVEKIAEIPSALDQMWQDPQAPFLLQVMIDLQVNAYPKIAFGLPITEMEPLAKPIDMEGT